MSIATRFMVNLSRKIPFVTQQIKPIKSRVSKRSIFSNPIPCTVRPMKNSGIRKKIAATTKEITHLRKRTMKGCFFSLFISESIKFIIKNKKTEKRTKSILRLLGLKTEICPGSNNDAASSSFFVFNYMFIIGFHFKISTLQKSILFIIFPTKYNVLLIIVKFI